jgi:hypothetical protein
MGETDRRRRASAAADLAHRRRPPRDNGIGRLQLQQAGPSNTIDSEASRDDQVRMRLSDVENRLNESIELGLRHGRVPPKERDPFLFNF